MASPAGKVVKTVASAFVKGVAKGAREGAKEGAKELITNTGKQFIRGRLGSSSSISPVYPFHPISPSPSFTISSIPSTPSIPTIVYNPQVTFPTKCVCSRPSANTPLTFNDKHVIDCMYCGSSNNSPEKVIDDYILLKGSATNLKNRLSAFSSFDQQKRFVRATEGLDSETTLANDELAQYELPKTEAAEGKISETEAKNNHTTELAQVIGLAKGGKRRNRSRKIRKRRTLETRRGGKN